MHGPADPLAWASHPRSQHAMTVVWTKAETDRQFRAIRDKLLRDGICTKTGKLLFKWIGQSWEPV